QVVGWEATFQCTRCAEPNGPAGLPLRAMLTERNLRKRREIERGKTAVTPSQNGMAAGSLAPDSKEHYSSVRPAHSRQLRVAFTSRWEIRELSNRLTQKGCENASMRERGRRRHSNLTPGCNSRDMVKVRQGKTLDARKNGWVEEGK